MMSSMVLNMVFSLIRETTALPNFGSKLLARRTGLWEGFAQG